MICNLNNNTSTITAGLYNKALSLKKPIACSIGITHFCNFQCIMCGYSYPIDSCYAKHSLSLNEWKEILTQLYSYGVLYITFTGGEPFVYEHFIELYVYAIKLGFKISIKTNAFLINESIVDLFKLYKPELLVVSLYGGSNKTYGIVTGNDYAYDIVVNNIFKLYNSNIKVCITLTLLKNNFNDIPSIINTFADYKIRLSVCSDIQKHINPNLINQYESIRLDPAKRVCIDKLSIFRFNEISNKSKELLKYLNSYDDIHLVDIKSSNQNKAYCFNTLTSFFIDCDGGVRYCQNYNTFVEYPLERGIDYSWNSLMNNIDNYFYEILECSACKYNKYCISNCPARLSLNGKLMLDKYTCQYAYLNYIYSNVLEK